MNHELICELQLALMPEKSLADRHVALSKQMATQYPALLRSPASPRDWRSHRISPFISLR